MKIISSPNVASELQHQPDCQYEADFSLFFFQYLATLAQFKISETSTVKPLALLDHNVIYLYQ